MLEKRQGFTLIEMLGAVLILGLLFLLVIPSIISQIRKTTDDIDEATKKMIFSSSETYIAKNSNKYPKTKGNVYCISIQELINSKELIEDLVDGKTGKKIDPSKMIEISIENEANITYKIVNECDEIINEPEEPIYYTDASGANEPKLLKEMEPVIWDATAQDNNGDWVVPSDGQEWYNYGAKQWANARTTDDEGGVAYWVWIPRYAYKIGPKFHTSNADTINIRFLNGTTNDPIDSTVIETVDYDGSENGKNTSNNFFLHPAFNFSNDPINSPNQIEGFWVAKFEPSMSSTKINVVPNVTPVVSRTVSQFYMLGLNMKDYICNGNCDTHMMKNIEWGAVAYLSRSQYGNPNEIWKNAYSSSSKYKTGCSGTNVNDSSSSTCVEWNTENGQRASTTGNVYGVYDMKGGAWEYVAAYVNNGHGNLMTYGSNIVSADLKYKDVYTEASTDNAQKNYEAAKDIYGDAIWETSSSSSGSTSWHTAYSYFVYSSNPWLIRGGGAGGTGVGVFYFNGNSGAGGGSYYSFRPVALR